MNQFRAVQLIISANQKFILHLVLNLSRNLLLGKIVPQCKTAQIIHFEQDDPKQLASEIITNDSRMIKKQFYPQLTEINKIVY